MRCKGIFIGLFALAGPVLASDYCSLVVDVVTPGGKRPVADVTVIEQNGRKQNQIVKGREARFCDLGVSPVNVKVGGDGTCNQVTVNNVPLSWQKTYRLKITYDPEPCLEESPHLSRFCTYVFRISDTSGTWISGASVRVMPGDFTLTTDAAGRASSDVKIGKVSAVITAPGFSTESVDTTCNAQGAAEPQDVFVRLARR